MSDGRKPRIRFRVALVSGGVAMRDKAHMTRDGSGALWLADAGPGGSLINEVFVAPGRWSLAEQVDE